MDDCQNRQRGLHPTLNPRYPLPADCGSPNRLLHHAPEYLAILLLLFFCGPCACWRYGALVYLSYYKYRSWKNEQADYLLLPFFFEGPSLSKPVP